MALESLADDEVEQPGLRRDGCYRDSLAYVAIIGELAQHTVREVRSRGEPPVDERLRYSIVGDCRRLEEARRAYDGPIEVAVPQVYFHPPHVSLERFSHAEDDEWLQDFLEDKAAVGVMEAHLWIGRARAYTDQSTYTVAPHGLHDMLDAL